MKTPLSIAAVGLLIGCLLPGCADRHESAAEAVHDGAAGATIVHHAVHDAQPGEITMSEQDTTDKIVRTNDEWRELLTPEQYRIMREQGTEPAFTGKYWDEHAPGTYVCAACGQELFASETKFESGTGWPSFFQPADPAHVEEAVDRSHGSVRTEVHCSRCGGHLGHVFNDGPKPTGLRYCLNSASLRLVADADAE